MRTTVKAGNGDSISVEAEVLHFALGQAIEQLQPAEAQE